MIKIRANTFETNSSSTHSLIILNNYKYKKALKVANPILAEEFEKAFGDDNVYTAADLFKSLKDLGATINEDTGEVDLSEIKEEDYDFGYTGPKAYVDPGHKLLFVLTMLDRDGWGYDYGDYCQNRFDEMLHDIGIHAIIPPKGGWTGIDHQSREEIEYQVKYDIENFIFRKDYVLLLDHD